MAVCAAIIAAEGNNDFKLPHIKKRLISDLCELIFAWMYLTEFLKTPLDPEEPLRTSCRPLQNTYTSFGTEE